MCQRFLIKPAAAEPQPGVSAVHGPVRGGVHAVCLQILEGPGPFGTVKGLPFPEKEADRARLRPKNGGSVLSPVLVQVAEGEETDRLRSLFVHERGVGIKAVLDDALRLCGTKRDPLKSRALLPNGKIAG